MPNTGVLNARWEEVSLIPVQGTVCFGSFITDRGNGANVELRAGRRIHQPAFGQLGIDVLAPVSRSLGSA